MTLRRLREAPGSRCFVCAPGNPRGLAVPLWYDDADGHVEATVRFDELHCGAPTYVHSGLAMAVLAEAMAWAVVTTTGRIAITLASSTDFHRPLRVDVPYRARAEIGQVAGTDVRASAVFRADAEVLATATGTFRVISEKTAARLRARVSRPEGTSSNLP
ncbi:PaaI family thioesterase [Micromonospora echinaurantiaca]|uniref:PaaI family thioesterase n=1 Tax=Micromonospora echinaurantiaca TaxID=47857 RepID=UPI0037200AFC